jgi:hypothetical protein
LFPAQRGWILEKPSDHLTILATARALLIIAEAPKMKNVMPNDQDKWPPAGGAILRYLKPLILKGAVPGQ